MTSSEAESLLLAIGSFAIILVIILLAVLVLYIVGRWNLFKKAGKNGWEAIIPLYADWIYVEISGLNWWWFLLVIASTICSFLNTNSLEYIASIASLFGLFVCNYNIAKKMHQNVSLAILMTLFPIIVIPLLGFSKKYTYDQNVPVSKNGPFANNSNTNSTTDSQNNTTTSQNGVSYCPNCGNQINQNERFCSKCGKEIN